MIDPTDLADRLSIVFTMLLTIVAFKLVVADKLPKHVYKSECLGTRCLSNVAGRSHVAHTVCGTLAILGTLLKLSGSF